MSPATPSLPIFTSIKANVILCDGSLCREDHTIECFCSNSEDELKTIGGCGVECINRILLTECGSRFVVLRFISDYV